MLKPTTTIAISGAAATLSASVAFADGPFTFVSSTPSQLEELGFANLTPDGPLVSAPTGGCAGCYTLPFLSGPLPLQAFFQITVEGGLPVGNDGMYTVMTFDFADPSFGVDDMISIINGSSAEAYNINYAPNPTCTFGDFLDPALFNADNTIVFRWAALAGQSTFTFGWDFTGGSGFAGSLFPGVSVTGAGSVPAPGALALLAVAGAGRRRARR